MPIDILVVEDDIVIRETLKEVLALEGYSVATAENGLRALNFLEREPPPQLILLDLAMPQMDGMAFRERQVSHPLHSEIPVVLMSADSLLQKKAAELNLKYLRKPLVLDDLLQVVKMSCCVLS